MPTGTEAHAQILFHARCYLWNAQCLLDVSLPLAGAHDQGQEWCAKCHASVLSNTVERHSDQWQSECKNTHTILRISEVTCQQYPRMQPCTATRLAGPLQRQLAVRQMPACRSRRWSTLYGRHVAYGFGHDPQCQLACVSGRLTMLY